MKNSFLHVVVFLTLSLINLQNSFSQCCPYIDNVELSPTAATDVDDVLLILQVTTPSLGNFIGYEITETDTLTTVEACYYNGFLAALQTYNDTLNLGPQNAGTFKVKFIAWISSDDAICNYGQSQFVDREIEIEGTNSVSSIQASSFSVFPNPIENNKITVSAKKNISKIQIYNQVGILVLEKNNIQNNNLTLELSHLETGIYFLKSELESGVFFTKKIIKR